MDQIKAGMEALMEKVYEYERSLGPNHPCKKECVLGYYFMITHYMLPSAAMREAAKYKDTDYALPTSVYQDALEGVYRYSIGGGRYKPPSKKEVLAFYFRQMYGMEYDDSLIEAENHWETGYAIPDVN